MPMFYQRLLTVLQIIIIGANPILGIIGGIWSFMAAFYIYLFGLGLIYPWGIVQKSRLFKNKYKKKLLPFADLQSDEPDIEDKSNTKEYEISSIKKQLDNLKKRVQFYENIIDISLLNSIKADDIDNSSSP
ncbi:1233_t:CDS:2 [Dentiscutata erythropus]|uniref:1233_t:CDS:1 n=1 Tax=Dentiscutata erythropus TaxID=1348616 RepID=A0A9N9IP33_9GLOM|nr:1233_t:CDS:2 [Dentiscutata erythropus]